MKPFLVALSFVLLCFISGKGQTNFSQTSKAPTWTEADRKFLLDNLMRSKQELIDETKNLTEKQWNFKESPDRWSINQIVEHLCIWHLIAINDISTALQMGPFPDFDHYLPDSLFTDSNPDVKKQKLTTEYTKPFTYGVPLGNNAGKNNVIWFLTMRNESIEHLKSETRNIRAHYICFGPNIHQRYMMIFQHSFRHLQQIRKVKAHPNYPK